MGILLCTAPGMVWLPEGSVWQFSKGRCSAQNHPVDRPWLPQSPPPTWHSEPVAERSFCPSVSSSMAITRQLHEHMEDAWQLLDTDAGLCNALSPSAASERCSGCLDVFVPACGRDVLRALLGCETLGIGAAEQAGWGDPSDCLYLFHTQASVLTVPCEWECCQAGVGGGE